MSNSGTALAAVRKALGMTRAELAEASGVHENTIWRLESGAQSDIALRKAQRIARALKVEIQDLWPDGTGTTTE
jgi:transcriptional regulator with XRE-family HTH domain